MLNIKNTIKHNGALLLLFLLISSCKETNTDRFFTIQGEAQGSTYAIKYIFNNDLDLKPGVEKILEDIDNSMSTYKNSSIISRINNGDTTAVADHYFEEVFRASKTVWEQSGGAFDPTVGTMVNIWGFGPNGKRNILDSVEIDSALKYVGLNKLQLSKNNRIIKTTPNIKLDFNAIAQGYTVDVLSDFMEKNGIKDYIVEVGGEMVVKGENSMESKPWVIGIDDPLQPKDKRILIAKIQLRDKGMATSGNYRKVIVDSITGEKYVHTINPKTGYPQKSNVLSATVIMPSCMMADAYATTFMVMDLEATKSFLNKNDDIDVMILYIDQENQLQKYMTDGFKKLLKD